MQYNLSKSACSLLFSCDVSLRKLLIFTPNVLPCDLQPVQQVQMRTTNVFELRFFANVRRLCVYLLFQAAQPLTNKKHADAQTKSRTQVNHGVKHWQSFLSRILLVSLGLQFFHCNKLLIVSLYYAAAWHFNLGSDFSLWVSGHNLKSKTNLDESSARR